MKKLVVLEISLLVVALTSRGEVGLPGIQPRENKLKTSGCQYSCSSPASYTDGISSFDSCIESELWKAFIPANAPGTLPG